MTRPNTFHHFPNPHTDLILASAYNLHATRCATASSDHRIKLWSRDTTTTTTGGSAWIPGESWIAHDAEITDVAFTGPYAGECVGTIGEDGYFRLWAEDGGGSGGKGMGKWRKVYELSSPTGVPFMGLGFKSLGAEEGFVALCTRDGFLSVLERREEGEGQGWRVMWADHVGPTPARTEETGFRLCWHGERFPAWTAVKAGLERKALGLAVGVGGVVRVFRTDGERKFFTAAVLEVPGKVGGSDGGGGLVRDVAWAGGSVRGFDLIATASKDGFVRVWELHTPAVGGAVNGAVGDAKPAARPLRSGIGDGLAGGARGRRDESAGVPGAVKQEAKLVAELETHGGAPWRVAWAPMGDILVSSGDDGTVKVWKKAVDGKWLEAAEVDAVRGG